MGHLTAVGLQTVLRQCKPISGKSDGSGLTFTVSKAQVEANKSAQPGTLTGTFEPRYRFGGRARWLTIGKYPDIDLKEARKRAAKERVRAKTNAVTRSYRVVAL